MIDDSVKTEFKNADDHVAQSPGLLHNLVLEIPPLRVVVTHMCVSPSNSYDMLFGLDVCRHYNLVMDIGRELYQFDVKGGRFFNKTLVAMIPEPRARKDGYRNPPLDCDVNEFEGWYASFRRETKAEVIPGFPFKELT